MVRSDPHLTDLRFVPDCKTNSHRPRQSIDADPYGVPDLDRTVRYREKLSMTSFAAPRQTHESGQIVIDRSAHFPSLTVALFLMAYPNNVFETLLTDSLGMGDKEMYAWSATGWLFHGRPCRLPMKRVAKCVLSAVYWTLLTCFRMQFLARTTLWSRMTLRRLETGMGMHPLKLMP